ncbi:hypothetical protein KO527_23910 [Pseudoalteromonas sp. C2R02]|uniref:hypothetical protein n=1 Tax=Pseudoalteromonas sp. C2R02 TaxID=2841565 RepID=UPI001C0960B6|nr:hypothetical protein [Pseudoalteromonas sp. C2R02]MBU2972385.1 hypothetical protein [Pseudoalteromonas sp. C2R02]
MEVAEGSRTPRRAFAILILQLVAWILISIYFFDDYSTGNDAAGAGMARGFAVFFVVVPCMAFIFFTTLYFFKRMLPTWFRFVLTFNYVALFLVFAQINW